MAAELTVNVEKTDLFSTPKTEKQLMKSLFANVEPTELFTTSKTNSLRLIKPLFANV